MGYTKIIIYGNTIERYDYENTYVQKKKAPLNANKKKRLKEIRLMRKIKGTYERTPRSIKRSRDNFFRLVHHNNHLAKTINFVTLTFMQDIAYADTTLYIKKWFQRINSRFEESSLSYISVPELTKKGRYHFHLLVYNLPPEASIRERETRNLQRQFNGGFLDIRPATYTTEGIAGYMAKYLAKHLKDEKTETKRGYNCSRNIEKYYVHGSNQLSTYEDILVPNVEPSATEEYEVPYLGRCKKIIIKN